MLAILPTLVAKVPAAAQNHLLNGHLKVAAESWPPYFIIYCNRSCIVRIELIVFSANRCAWESYFSGMRSNQEMVQML